MLKFISQFISQFISRLKHPMTDLERFLQKKHLKNPLQNCGLLVFSILKLAVFILFVGGIVLAPRDAEARRHRHHSRKKRAAIINEKKLYERIGGKQVLNEIADDWVRNGLSDDRIAPLFDDLKANPSSLAKFRRALNEQLCEISDGPCQYNGPDLKKFKAGAKFDDWHIVAFADDLFRALEKRNIAEREKNELLGRVGWLRADLLGLPSRPPPMPN